MVNVTVSVGLLHMSLGMPDEHKDNVIGLLGNFNDDPSDDYIPQNSNTPLPANASERDIFFDFGQTCMFLLTVNYLLWKLFRCLKVVKMIVTLYV